jgi:hypothetical protein
MKKSYPDRMQQKLLAEELSASLAQLASSSAGGKRFYRVLSILFNDGASRERDPELQALAGLQRVQRFCKKIEDWAGMPLQRLKTASHRADDDAAGAARTELRHLDGLPRFDRGEIEAIRHGYLQPEECEFMAERDDIHTRRRVLIGGAVGAFALTAGTAFASYPKKTERVDSPPLDPEKIRTQLAGVLKAEEDTLEALQPGTPAQQEQEYSLVADMATFASAFPIVALMVLLRQILIPSGKETDDQDHYAKLNTHLRSNIIDIAGRFSDGVDPLLKAVAQRAERVQDL